MEYEHIILERKEDIATLTLNRPEKLNAINQKMMHAWANVSSNYRKCKGRRYCISGKKKASIQGKIECKQERVIAKKVL